MPFWCSSGSLGVAILHLSRCPIGITEYSFLFPPLFLSLSQFRLEFILDFFYLHLGSYNIFSIDVAKDLFTYQVMESENGVIEMPQVDNSAVVLTNEGEIVDDSGQKAPALNEILEPMAETEHISSSKTKIQATATVPKSKSVKASKVFSLGYSVIDRSSDINGYDYLCENKIFLIRM